ncbi:MAG: site-2 protease family protein [Anaerolineae bacterium]|nr:MAG: site-2 protease family protein [Anaerolineae bacterium]
MMRGSLTLGKIFGIPIKLHTSWFLVAALVTWSLAGGYFPREYPGWATTTYWIVGAATAVLFFAAVLLHELGHSIVALREKVPVRNITLFIFGGVAQIGSEPQTAGAEFRIAIAGPLTSLALAGLSSLLSLSVASSAVMAAPLAYLARINLGLALFNLIPGFPLDGGRVLRAVLWGLGGSLRTATKWATRVGRGVAFTFILMGIGQMFLGGFVNGLWLAFIGWFIKDAAESNYRQVVIKDMLTGVTVSDVMTQQCMAVPGDLRLDRLVADHVLGTGQQCFFVIDNGEVKGLITLQNIRAVPRERGDQVTVSQIMTPVDASFQAGSDEEVLTLLQRMDEANVNQVPVTEGGSLLGLFTRGNLLQYMRLRSELGV